MIASIPSLPAAASARRHHQGRRSSAGSGASAASAASASRRRRRSPLLAPAASSPPATTPPPIPTVPGVEGDDDVPVVPSARPLFQPFDLGPGLRLEHRLVLAPLTRSRGQKGYVASPASAAQYYGERAASAPGTLLISEASPISPQACGYPNTPGMWTQDQVEAWRPVVQAVHAKKGIFCAQLWHVGRASCALYQPEGQPPVSSSPIAIPEPWTVYGPQGEGPFPYPVPRALTTQEIDGVVGDFARATTNAIQGAGFDLVEVHAANGYLISQFLSDGCNQRDDEYGSGGGASSSSSSSSSPEENRARLLVRCVQAAADAAGSAGKVGVRLSPFNEFLACVESDPLKTYGVAVDLLLKLRASKGDTQSPLAYLHFVEPRLDASFEPRVTALSLAPFVAQCRAAGVPVITAGGWEPEAAAEAVAGGHADLICVGREWIGAPDLPKRWALGLRGSKGDRGLYYSGGEEGYLGYPPLSGEEERAAVERARALSAAAA